MMIAMIIVCAWEAARLRGLIIMINNSSHDNHNIKYNTKHYCSSAAAASAAAAATPTANILLWRWYYHRILLLLWYNNNNNNNNNNSSSSSIIGYYYYYDIIIAGVRHRDQRYATVSYGAVISRQPHARSEEKEEVGIQTSANNEDSRQPLQILQQVFGKLLALSAAAAVKAAVIIIIIRI